MSQGDLSNISTVRQNLIKHDFLNWLKVECRQKEGEQNCSAEKKLQT